ncbi:MAG: hypothetical protein KDC49_12490 [Saprospiraceae bacterium]|nr:hypothetical protein [Saprospiraceae bacterium]
MNKILKIWMTIASIILFTQCVKDASCSDGIKNGDEVEVDCGGTCAPCATCTDGLKNGLETEVDCGGTCGPCYKVGDVGKYGGIVFYVKLDYSDGWRYLESYKQDVLPKEWGCLSQKIFFLDNSFGGGKKNTDYLNTLQCNVGYAFAAQYVHGLVLNGHDEWYLPNSTELGEMYKNRNLIGGFVTNGAAPYYSYYWSSYASSTATEGSNVFDFKLGMKTSNGRGGSYRIRPITRY